MSNVQSSAGLLIPIVWAAVAGCLVARAFAAAPVITRIEPSAAIPAETTECILAGENLNGAVELWTSFPCEVSAADRAGAPAFRLTVPADVPPGLGMIRLITTNGVSNPQLFLIDSIRHLPGEGTNRSLATARSLPVPGAVDGVCDEVRSDFYQMSLKRGQRVSLEVVAQRTGSALDPLLRLLDVGGRELAVVDDTPGLGSDARLDFRCPKSGQYIVEVRDTRYTGGPRHRYQLRLARPLPTPLPFLAGPDLATCAVTPTPPDPRPEREPNDALSQAQWIHPPVEIAGRFAKPGDRDVYGFRAEQGERLLFRGRTRSLGSPCDLFLQLQASNGVKLAEANASSAEEGLLTNRFQQTGTFYLVVEELNRRGGPDLLYRLAVQSLPPGFGLSVETERVSVPAGDSFDLEVQVERRDYDGPIRLGLIGLAESFALTNDLVPAKTNTMKFQVTVPRDRALGEFRHFGITGSAIIGQTNFTARASTLPAWHQLFPDLRYPPPELDGAIALCIASSKSTNATPGSKKQKK